MHESDYIRNYPGCCSFGSMKVNQLRRLDMYAELRNLQQILDELTASFQRCMLGIGRTNGNSRELIKILT